MRPSQRLRNGSAIVFLGSVFAMGGSHLSAVSGWTPGPWCEGSDPGSCEADCDSEAFAHCDWVCDQQSEEWTGNSMLSSVPGADCQDEDPGDHQYHGLVYCECS